MGNCPHPLESIRRFKSSGPEVDAAGLVCTACGQVLTVHFFPKDPQFAIAPVHGDPEWRSKSGFSWTDPKAEGLEEISLDWAKVQALLPPKSEWSQL
jgi:hypothetical protein